jgi:lysozyme
MTLDEIKNSIKQEEGCRLNAYADTRGNLTIGYGHLIRLNTPIPQEAADAIFEADFERAVEGYNSLDLDLDPVRKSVIIDMIFNMGIYRVKDFRQMIKHLQDKNWIQAAHELMDSEYAKQVPGRARRNRDKILKG